MNAQVPTTESSEIKTYDMVQASEMLFDPVKFKQLESFARIMASGASTVPKHLAGNIGDCMAVTMQAMQWGMNPFAVAQKTHLINGSLGYEAQLVNAVITSMAPTTGRLEYEWFGDWDEFLKNTQNKQKEVGCGVIISATIKGEDKPRELSLLMAQATVRNSPLWVADPKQQLVYLGTKKWARLYTPDVIMGVYSPDELVESPSASYTVNAIEQAETIEEAELVKPEYDDARFDNNWPKYSKAIEEDRATADDVIANIEERHIMTEEQKDKYIAFELDIKASKE